MSGHSSAAAARPAEYGSDVVAEVLTELGVEAIAFAPGATFRGLHDSLVNHGGPQLIECLHEEISVAIAHGYAKAAGKPMAVALHDVVGLQHASMAIYNAWCDRVPLVAIGGTGPVDAARRRPWIDWIHTANVQATQVRDYTKWDDQPASLEAVTESLVRAHRLACAEPPGPVYVCLDSEIQEQRLPAGFHRPLVDAFPVSCPAAPDRGAVDVLARRLVDAEWPVVVADHTDRAQATNDQLVELAELLAVPVVEPERDYNKTSLCFPTQHPLNLSGVPLPKVPDVVLSLEAGELGGVVPVDPRTWVVEVSMAQFRVRAWAADLQRLQPAAMCLPASAGAALFAVTERVRELVGAPEVVDRVHRRREAVTAAAARQRARWRATAQANADAIDQAYLALALDDATRAVPRVLANGHLDNWVHRLWDLDRADAYLGGSGGAGLGYGLGASIGAAFAHQDTDRLVLDIQTDGDALMTPGALWTAARYRLPLLVVMDNNRRFDNSVRHAARVADARGRSAEQRFVGTEIAGPTVSFAGLAKAFGVPALGPVDRPEELAKVLKEAVDTVLHERLPLLVDVVTESGRGG